MSVPLHPICMRRQRRLRVMAVLLFIDAAALWTVSAINAAPIFWVAPVIAAVIAVVAVTRHAYLLHFRCPGRPS